MLLADARQAIKEEAPLDRVRSLTGEVQQVYQGLMTHQGMGSGGQPQGGPGGPGQGQNQGQNQGQGQGGQGDDVIDADFTQH
jgi:molecular chaperone DnaK